MDTYLDTWMSQSHGLTFIARKQAEVIIEKAQGDLEKAKELIAEVSDEMLREEINWVIGWINFK